MGSIYSALITRLDSMGNDEIAAIPTMTEHVYYRTLMGDLRSSSGEAETAAIKQDLRRRCCAISLASTPI